MMSRMTVWTRAAVVLGAVWAGAGVGTGAAWAQVKLHGLFADGAVLQREMPVPVWGWASAGEKVAVEFAGQTKEAVAGADGLWRVVLDAMPASGEGRELVVRAASGEKRAKDVVVGEVWVAGGQSNMRSPLFAAHNADEVLPKATDRLVRQITVTLRTSAEPAREIGGDWKSATPETARDFYAVGYFFAQRLRAELGGAGERAGQGGGQGAGEGGGKGGGEGAGQGGGKGGGEGGGEGGGVPVGIVGVAWGGTPIQTWISLEGIKEEPALKRLVGEWDKALVEHAKVKADPSLVTKYLDDLKRWQREVETPWRAEVKKWDEAKARGEAVGERPKVPSPEPSNPDPMGMPSPSRRPGTPTVSFNGLIAPIAGSAARGVIWYQGEADGSRGVEYRQSFPRMIRDWRRAWGKSGGEWPFLFVQLPANGPDKEPVASAGWPWVREAQQMALAEPGTGMAVTLDVGDPADVHPKGKAPVGERLARVALREVYGRKDVVASGPVYASMKVDGGTVRVKFNEVGGGLVAGQAPWRAPSVPEIPTDKVIGFFVAGEDRKWVAATGKIEGDEVVLTPEAPVQGGGVAVRYGWANSPRVNLYNRDGLPAAPFRTDTWEK